MADLSVFYGLPSDVATLITTFISKLEWIDSPVQFSQLKSYRNICVDGNKNIFITDGHSILVLTPSYGSKFRFDSISGPWTPFAMCCNDKELFCSTFREGRAYETIEAVDLKTLSSWRTVKTTNRDTSYFGMAIYLNELYVVERSGGRGVVVVLDYGGFEIRRFGDDILSVPRHIVVFDNHVYVTNAAVVHRFDLNGKWNHVFDHSLFGGTAQLMVRNISIDAVSGLLFVLDSCRIFQYRLDGTKVSTILRNTVASEIAIMDDYLITTYPMTVAFYQIGTPQVPVQAK